MTFLRDMRLTVLIGLLVVVLAASSLHAQAVIDVHATEPTLFNDFDRPFDFAYLSFEGKSRVIDSVATINAPKGNGGAGHTHPIELRGLADQCPVLVLKLGSHNRARQLRLVCDDAGKNQRAFVYDLDQANAHTFTPLYPQHGLALSPAAMGEDLNPFDPARLAGHHLQGDWQNTAVHVEVDRIELRPPLPVHTDQRRLYLRKLEEQREKARQQAQRQADEKAKLLAGAAHPEDGPQVKQVSAVGSDMLAVQIQERTLLPQPQVPYEPQAGDEIVREGQPVLAWSEGKPAFVPRSRKVKRKPEGKNQAQTLGVLTGDGKALTRPVLILGQGISELTVREPAAYRIGSSDDVSYTTPVPPKTVHLKATPVGVGEGGVTRKITIYLELPQPMAAGKTYTLTFQGVNTRQPDVSFTYDSRVAVSPAVHVSHVGYRPDDPYKRALLSQWLGTGGARTFDAVSFELLDERGGDVAFQGQVTKVLDADDPENLRGANRNKTHVYAMDFGRFTKPGLYRVHVPGVGVSLPFRIDDDAWRDAFIHAMKGFTQHRSGIELSSEIAGYRRPRPMHPDDGLVVFESDVTIWNGEADAIRDSLTRLLGPTLDTSKLRRVPEAWGGYMDAGDWDRRSQHLESTYLQLENYRLFPDYFSRIKLVLPGGEAQNDIPDLLDEALWNVRFYQRLQREDGGVRGGIESTDHPHTGEASWQESLLVAAFLPDPQSSYRFAASAALLAHLLKPYDSVQAQKLAGDAVRAYDWAEAHSEAVIAEAAQRGPRQPQVAKLTEDTLRARALAAVELLRHTGEARYHDAFVDITASKRPEDRARDLVSLFAYLTLPEAMRDAALHQELRSLLIAEADKTLRFGDGNALGVSHRVADLPMIGWIGYFTVPESVVGPTLTRAHHLTGEEKYLAAAIRAAGYSVGLNPTHMTMTTGLGHAWPRHLLHVDSAIVGQPVPPGITVYGPHDVSNAPAWVKQWFLKGKMVPDIADWPAAEAYVDLGNWAEMNEYTIHQTIGPVAHYWGYLAARP